MKKRIFAILTSVFMLIAMVPAMAFAEDDGPNVRFYTYEVDDLCGFFDVTTYGEGGVDDVMPNQTDYRTTLAEGSAIKDTFKDIEVRANGYGPFEGWMIYEVLECVDDAGDVVEVFERMDEALYSTEEILNRTVADNNIAFVAKWESIGEDEYFNYSDDEDGDWNGIHTFAVSGNGGSLVIKDSAENFNGSTDSYYGEFRSSENVAKAVSFKIVSAEKTGAVLSGWTVYEADRIEIDSIPASVAKENGGLPPWGDPDLKHFLFDEYVEDGVEMNTFIGLWSSKLIDTAMSTEDLYNLGGNDKSYYAVANWTTGTVQEMTVNGQPARLEIAGGIVAVDSNLKAKFETVEKIKEALVQEAYRANENFLEESMKIEYMDIVLKIKNKDGVWEVATPENFPEEGIEVVIPYPAETNKDAFQFSVLHMFTHGSKAGSIETLKPEIKNDGLHVVVHSLSPFAVAYQEMDKSPAMGDTANMLPWIIMAVMAAAAGALVFRRRTN